MRTATALCSEHDCATGVQKATPVRVVAALADARRDRLVEAREGIPTILWVVLGVGAIVTVGFTYLFGLDDTTTHTLMVALLALVIGLVLFTIGSLEYPFSGDVRLGPDAFQLVLERFASSKLSVL